MKIFFIIFVILIILTTWFWYEMFVLYGTFMGAIANPDCPEIECFCPEIVCKKCEPFSYQSCRYEIMCSELGHCPAQERSYKSELEICQRLLEDLEELN